jgi:cell division protein ZapA
MNNSVTVNVGNQSYTLTTAEDSMYTQQVAAFVDEELRKVSQDGRLSSSDAAVLTALNIADSYFKERETSDNLRHQLKEYLEEASRVKNELSEAKREIFRLQNKKS